MFVLMYTSIPPGLVFKKFRNLVCTKQNVDKLRSYATLDAARLNILVSIFFNSGHSMPSVIQYCSDDLVLFFKIW